MRLRSSGSALAICLGSLTLVGCAGDPTACTNEYASNSAAINAAGQTREAFLAACVAGTESRPYRLKPAAAGPAGN